MLFNNFVAEKLILPIGDFFTGMEVYSSLNFLLKSQWWSTDKLRDFQNHSLRNLINHAMNTVPYYSDLFKSIGIKNNDILSVDDLIKLPILTKDIIKDHGLERFESKLFDQKNSLPASSSGSTGEPLYYIQSKYSKSLNTAAGLRGWYWAGFRLGDKYVKLSQNPRTSFVKRTQDYMSRNKYLSTNPLIESNYKFILDEIEAYKPKIIRSYPDPLNFIAEYRQKSGCYSHIPNAIITTGNTLHSEVRRKIMRSFNTMVFDSYNCEGNPVVFECPSHTCYHSTMEYGITQVVDDNNNLIKNGVGRLISSDFSNLAFPFIRYDTQDLVEISDEPCVCGRNLLRINKILGRNNDVLEGGDGRKFIVHNFTGFFQSDNNHLNRSVEKFQIVKKEDATFVFKLIVNNQFTDDTANYITRFWQKELKSKIVIEIVENIPLTSSGKWRFVIKE